MLSIKTRVLVERALVEINAMDVGGAAQPEIFALGLETLNGIIDELNGDEAKLHADLFLPFALTPGLNPHLIGPAAPAGATWVTTEAPVDILGIGVKLSGSQTAFRALVKRDAAWWQRLSSPTITSELPNDFFYNPTWSAATPFGAVYLYPVPSVAHDVQLWCRSVLSQLVADASISLPPGYNRALMLATAKAVAVILKKAWSGQQEQALSTVWRQIASNNTTVPRLVTQVAGMPRSGGGNRPNFSWLDGQLR